MKRVLLLLIGLTLIGCDNRQYDVLLSCEDGANGKYLIDAKIDKNKADLDITRLSKELRGKHKEWLAEHLWLYNQIPEIDDTIHVSLPVDEVFSVYQEENHIKLDMRHDSLDGGLRVTLWHASDNDLSMDDGEKIPDGEWMIGTVCEPVIERKIQTYDKIPSDKLKKIKACASYLESQNFYDTVAPRKAAFVVYDENSDREMFVSKEQMNVLTNGIEFNHLVLQNVFNYPQDAVFACEVAERLKTYVKEHIDIEGKPVYVAENVQCGTKTIKIEIYQRYIKVYSGSAEYRLEPSKENFDDFGDSISKTYENDIIELRVYKDGNDVRFNFMERNCSLDGDTDKEIIDTIFAF